MHEARGIAVRRMLRAFILLVLLSGLAWWLNGEQERGRFRQVDEYFLDFLLANTRDQLKPDAAKLGDVVFVRLREEDKKEYAGWPPLPIDYLMITKGLSAFEPAVLVIADPLRWPDPKPDSLPELAQALLPIPGVVLGVESSSEGAGDAVTLAFIKDHLPVLERLQGQTQMLPGLHQLARLPEPVLLPQRDIGVVTGPPWSMALRYEDHAVPSLVLAALSRATRTPFAHQRLQVGPGAGAHLGAALFVPLQNDGSLFPSNLAAPSVNGLDLMTANIIDPEADVAKILGKGKTIVVGIDNDGPAATPARLQAQAIAGALSLPRVRVLTLVEQIAAWAVAALLSLMLVRLPKHKAVWRTLLLLFAALAASYLAFQVAMVWCPPAIPAALIAAAGLFVRLFGKRAPTNDVAPSPPIS